MSGAEQTDRLVIGPLTAQDDADNNAATDEQRRRAHRYFTEVATNKWPAHWLACLHSTQKDIGLCSEIVIGVLLKCIRHDDTLSAGGAR